MAIEYTPESSLVADPAEGGSFSTSNNAELAGAQSFAAKAKLSETAAATSETAAATSETNAATSETNAATSATNANAAKVSAESARDSAAADSVSAESAKVSAETARDTAAGSATTATTQAGIATTKAGEALTSANNASSSATSALGSATTATTQASTATTQAGIATTQAGISTTQAGISTTQASTATTQAGVATTQASTATTQAGIATTKASEASTSETNAGNSAIASANSATASLGSATNSANSATSAGTAQTAAEAARDAALAAFDSFDDRYLGQKTSDPSTDNDGNALVAGTLYFNTTTDAMMVYEGSSWVAAYASLSGALIANNNLSDLNNAATARTNIGLGTNSSPAFTGLAVDTNTLIVDSTNNRVGIKRGTPTAELDVNGTIKAVDLDVTGGESYLCRTHSTTNASLSVLRMCAKSTGDMQDGFGTGITFDAGDNDGTISSQVAEINAVRAGSDDIFNLELQTGDVSRLTLGTTGATIATGTSGTDRFKVDSSGNVGINTGTNSITEKLDVVGNIAVSGTVDGRDVAGDGTKLDGVEASADVTDTANVVAALSAGTGISLSNGGVVANTSPDQTVSLTGTGATSVSGTYPNFTINSTDTNTDTDTTYTAGTGITLTGTEFAIGQDVATTASPTFASINVNGLVTSDDFQIDLGTATAAAQITTPSSLTGFNAFSIKNTHTEGYLSFGTALGKARIKATGANGSADPLDIDVGNVTAIGIDTSGNVSIDAGLFLTSPNNAFQRVDGRDSDTTESRAHWYGVDSSGGTQNFRHAWYDGSSYVNVDVNNGGVGFNGYLKANRLYSNADGSSGYFYNDSGTRTAYTGGDFYIKSDVGNYYNYATNQYLGNTSGDVIRLRGNQLIHNGWDARADGHFRFNDSKKLLFGNGSDVEVFFSGSHFYIDLESGGNNMYIRDGSTTRFTFDDAGHFTATGNVTAYSDRRLKDDIQPIEGALEKVGTLSGNTYQRNDLLDKDPERRYAGVIAQEVEVVLPEAVSEAEDGTKTVDYNAVIALLVESVKELKAEVEQLKGGA